MDIKIRVIDLATGNLIYKGRASQLFIINNDGDECICETINHVRENGECIVQGFGGNIYKVEKLNN